MGPGARVVPQRPRRESRLTPSPPRWPGAPEEMVALSKDAGRKERMDRLVKELADRFRAQKSEGEKGRRVESGPTVLTFVDFQEKGGLAER